MDQDSRRIRVTPCFHTIIRIGINELVVESSNSFPIEYFPSLHDSSFGAELLSLKWSTLDLSFNCTSCRHYLSVIMAKYIADLYGDHTANKVLNMAPSGLMVFRLNTKIEKKMAQLQLKPERYDQNNILNIPTSNHSK